MRPMNSEIDFKCASMNPCLVSDDNIEEEMTGEFQFNFETAFL